LDPHRYLDSLVHFGQKFGLETIQRLCEGLGHPETAYTTFLIAGTNGKGSVAAYLDHALRAAGKRVGRYTSPHLVRVNERIVVDGREIDDHELAGVLARVQAVVAQPTYFEALTAAAFEHFRAAGVDVAVLEVGMGGRLDATNVADPLVSAIVSIDFDHQVYLGTTLGEIAYEKAGVLRPGRVTVVGPLPDEAMAAVKAQAAVVGAHIRVASGTDRRLEAPLPGAHQRDNLRVAVGVLEAAAEAGFAVDLDAATTGLAGTSWPGRLQWLGGDVPLLLDGAHNVAGARALAAYLDARGEPFVLLFGAMRDKAFADMAAILFPRAREVVLTTPPAARAATADELLAAAPRTCHAVPEVGAALALARERARGIGPVVVAGSLYLVGAVLALIEGSGGASVRPPASPTRGDR
jgi:dihydrofolate synthase / folylpolyglutamate synthase